MFRRFRSNTSGALKMWQMALGGIVILMALGVIMPGNFIQQSTDDLLTGSVIGGEWTGSDSGSADPLIKVEMSTLKYLTDSTGVTADKVVFYSETFQRIDADASNDATTVEIKNVEQNRNVYVYAEDTTTYPVLYMVTTPDPGASPETTAYPMPPVEMPVKMAASDVDDYVLYGSTSLAGSNYNFTANGETPTWVCQLVVGTPSNAQDEVWGCDYTDPELNKHHSAYLILRSSVSGNRVISPGWTKVSDMTYDYYVKKVGPYECDYLSDGTYSQTVFQEDIQLQITDSNSDAATIVVNWHDDIEDEEIFKLNFGTADETATVTIQD